MSIPFLPLELYAEIVSHLRSPSEDDPRDSIEAGKAFSLVCRQLYPVGQALRWRNVKIIAQALPSLCDHFTLHPHLAPLVRIFLQMEGPRSRLGDPVSRALNTVLQALGELRILRIAGGMGETLPAIFEAASKLPRLLCFQASLTQELSWSPELASTFRLGFPSLSFLSLHFPRIGPSTAETARPSLLGLRPTLETLILRGIQPVEAQTVLDAFFTGSHLSMLRHLTVQGSPVSTHLFDILPKLSQLESLTLWIFPNSLPLLLPALLQRLPHISTLSALLIHVTLPISVVDSPVALSVFLAALPSSLALLGARRLRFIADESVPTLSLPEDGLVPCIVQILYTTLEGDRPMSIWKRAEQEEGTGWYCHVEKGKTWDEVDELDRQAEAH